MPQECAPTTFHGHDMVPSTPSRSDCIITKVEATESLDYSPIDSKWQAGRGTALQLQVLNLIPPSTPRRVKALEPQSTSVTTRGDGNCFSRSLGDLLTGVQSDHNVLHQVIVNFIEENEETFNNVAHCSNYAQESHTSLPGEWATEVEVVSAATLLATNVCIFSPYSRDYNGRVTING